jgi:hypothetical protein
MHDRMKDRVCVCVYMYPNGSSLKEGNSIRGFEYWASVLLSVLTWFEQASGSGPADTGIMKSATVTKF